MLRTLVALVLLPLPTLLFAQETLPVPGAKLQQAEKPTAQPAVEEDADPVVVGNLEHTGWGLTGPRGRHYFFGGLAMADYQARGERRIVALQQEEPSLLPRPDDKFLYYRELRSGNRWAIGRNPLKDGSYIIYFQGVLATSTKASESKSEPQKPKWQEFQRARLEWKS